MPKLLLKSLKTPLMIEALYGKEKETNVLRKDGARAEDASKPD